MEKLPRVSIGLPVYNGEEYLESAIESLLTQTYGDFELIISDNASTDRTAEISRRFAAADPRVRYMRNATNVGGMNNANLTFRLARGEYFRLAAHDDICTPTLLERLVKVLDERPEVTVCLTATKAIDANANTMVGYQGADDQGVHCALEGTAARAHERFRELTRTLHTCEATYGLMRSNIVRQTRLQQSFTSSDYVYLCELALRGPFYLIPEPLFLKRYHPGNSYHNRRARMVWSRPELAKSGRPTLPYWLQLAGYVRALNAAKLPWRERALCILWLPQWVIIRRRELAGDLKHASIAMLHSKKWRVAQYAPERWIGPE